MRRLSPQFRLRPDRRLRLCRRLLRRAVRFARREDGVISSLSLFLLTALILICGLALDVANVMTQRTHLQVAADASAHAALLSRRTVSELEARDRAIALAQLNMPTNRFGDVISNNDVVFGRWDWDSDRSLPSEQRFTAGGFAPNAVRVQTHRQAGLGNAIPTYLLRAVGLEIWNVTATSYFAGYVHPCLTEGLVARERIRLRSNNQFGNGFCVHSNEYVEFNNHNTFESGTVVSMPDLDRLGLPGSGFRHNDGLEAALREGGMEIAIIDEIPNIIDGLGSGNLTYLPEYITNTVPIPLESFTISSGDLEPGHIYTANCGSSGSVSVSGGTVISEVVLVTNCAINFGQNAQLHDSIFATTNTGSQSVHGAADVVIGRADNCAEGGDSQVLTMGGMHFAAKLSVNGGQLLAYGDINFAAQGAAVEGGSMIAGGEIDGTSNLDFNRCDTENTNNFSLPALRLVG